MTTTGDAGISSARRRMGIGAIVVLVIAALALTVAVGILRGALAPVDEVPLSEPVATPSAPAAALYVHVSGAVVSPGLYVLPDAARVVDAVAAAGGFVDDADSAAVNLARTLDDGEQLHVPRIGDAAAPVTGAPATGSPQEGGLIDLNTADAAQLETLPRIGPALAERIVSWRDDNGSFTSVEDLLAVPGIGDKMLESLRELVTV